MRFVLFNIALISVCLQLACTPAAPPVAIGNKPVSVNGVRTNEARETATVDLLEMSWAGFDGGVTKLKDLNGKAVILDFWATNCPPCIEEIPHLLSLKSKYGEELVVIGLHVGDDEDRKNVPAFVDKLKITYPLADPDTALKDFIFQTNSAIPQTVVFDRKGAMIRKIVGFNSEIGAELDRAVERAVGAATQN
ncbi:MAG: TlpA family protein disulfide reductase [Pyrinomonadaceae bacterium]